MVSVAQPINVLAAQQNYFKKPMHANQPFRPIFIVGCGRSGTTLLAVLLDRHPQLAITAETHFCIKLARLPSGGYARLLDHFYQWHRTAELGLSRDELAARFLTYEPSPRGLFRAALEEYAENHHKPRVGEKTPFHLWHVPTLLSWFPDAKVICTIRDGRDNVLSMLDAPWAAHKMLREHCRTWIRAAKAADKFQRKYPERFMLVRYEDLLAQTQAKLAAIDAFLGLPFDAVQLDPSVATDVVPHWERSWKQDATKEIDPSKISIWKTRATPVQRRVMNTMMGPMLRHFGYSDTVHHFDSPFARFRNFIANTACRIGLHRQLYKIILRHTPSAKTHRRTGGL